MWLFYTCLFFEILKLKGISGYLLDCKLVSFSALVVLGYLETSTVKLLIVEDHFIHGPLTFSTIHSLTDTKQRDLSHLAHSVLVAFLYVWSCLNILHLSEEFRISFSSKSAHVPLGKSFSWSWAEHSSISLDLISQYERCEIINNNQVHDSYQAACSNCYFGTDYILNKYSWLLPPFVCQTPVIV